jgi:hypothetical protein
MPRIVKHETEVARRIDRAVAAIVSNAPSEPTLRIRSAKGTLKLNFDTVQLESGVKRHLFDKSTSLYPAQHAAILGAMPKKGQSVPLAKLLALTRRALARTTEQLARSQAHAANTLALAHQLELEIARQREEIATLEAGGIDERIVGSGRLIGFPPPQRKPRGSGPGKTNRPSR